jgi:hypothetical protein
LELAVKTGVISSIFGSALLTGSLKKAFENYNGNNNFFESVADIFVNHPIQAYLYTGVTSGVFMGTLVLVTYGVFNLSQGDRNS